MDQKDRNLETAKFFGSCQTLMAKKVRAYAPSQDAFANFVRRAQLLRTVASTVILTDATKHVEALATLLLDPAVCADEDILHRCQDACNLLALLAVYCTVEEPTDPLPSEVRL